MSSFLTQAPRWWDKPSPISYALLPLAWAYGLAGKLRHYFAHPQSAPVPVVCIGNVTAGGAGKTPIAIAVAKEFLAQGKRVHFLTRGFGGTLKGPLQVDSRHTARDVGDEALLLAAVAPTWVARDRVAGANAAAQAGAQIIVMDDGFQNPHLRKDLSLLVVDGAYGFGNGLIIPAGPLREKLTDALSRPGAVVVIGEASAATAQALAPCKKPILHAAPIHSAPSLQGKDVVAFAGIGRPQKFFDSLTALGCRVIDAYPFPDHHPYTTHDMKRLADAAQKANATLVTTAKDAVRLPAAFREKVIVVSLEMRWKEEAMIKRLLATLA